MLLIKKYSLLKMFIGIKLLLISLWATSINAGLLNFLIPVTDKLIKFHIYTRSDRRGQFATNISDPQEVAKTGFDRSKETFICLHAWTESEDSPTNTCKRWRDLVLDSHDVNVIYVDWGFYSTQIFYTYLTMNLGKLAKVVSGEFKNMAETSGLDLGRSQMVSASLGADLAGAIGTELDGKLYQVIAVDPSAPMFYHSYVQTRISKKSGQFVHVIHMASGTSGLGFASGHADYYPNGGEHQPWCPIDFIGFCSHVMASFFYENTLKNGSHNVATKCDSYENYLSGACNDNDKSVVGGFHVDRNASGRYYSRGDGYKNF